MNNEIDQVHTQVYVASITGARTEPMDDYDAYGGRFDYEFFELDTQRSPSSFMR